MRQRKERGFLALFCVRDRSSIMGRGEGLQKKMGGVKFYPYKNEVEKQFGTIFGPEYGPGL